MDLFIKLFARNNQHLMELIHDKLQPLGLSRSETIISFSTSFDRQLPISSIEERLAKEETEDDGEMIKD